MSEWKAIEWSRHGASTVVVDDPSWVTGKRIVAECGTPEDAKVIAAAPDLLEAAQDVLAIMNPSIPGSPDSPIERLRAAIAKATCDCAGGQRSWEHHDIRCPVSMRHTGEL